jgi:GntR family transcriptional regulator/MocR family aminotransferase
MNRPVTIFNLNATNTAQPKYLQLAEVVRQAIRKGQLLAGDTLPSVKSLSNDLHLNRHTVMKAFAELIAEGWIESTQRVGYRVMRNLPIENSQSIRIHGGKQEKNEFTFRFVRAADSLSESSAVKYRYNFSGGRPDIALFPFAEFKRHMSDSLSRPNINQLAYGESAGLPELIEEVKRYLRKARAITDREIIITNGSQEAIFIVAQLLLKAGDKVAVEALGYPPAMSAFKSAGADLVAVMQDKDGLVPEDLEQKIHQGNIRLIYLTPLHQYPTTVTLTVSRRMRIYQLATHYGIPIIEDDYDHEFHYRCQPLAPMASQDSQRLVIYLSTFSKIMFPGARVGFMALSAPMAKAVTDYRVLVNHKSNVFMQSALARWMKDGGFERHIRRITRINQQRRNHAVALLQATGLFECDIPDGGMALWLKIKDKNVRASELAQKARSLGVYIQHGGEYYVVKTSRQDCYIRVGFAGMSEADFAQGIALLVTLF